MIGELVPFVGGLGVGGAGLVVSYSQYRRQAREHERERRQALQRLHESEVRAWETYTAARSGSGALEAAHGARRADTAWMDIVGIPLDLWHAARPDTDDLAILIARREAGGFQLRLDAPPVEPVESRQAVAIGRDAVAASSVHRHEWQPRADQEWFCPGCKQALAAKYKYQRLRLDADPQLRVTHSDETYVYGVTRSGQGWQVRRNPLIAPPRDERAT